MAIEHITIHHLSNDSDKNSALSLRDTELNETHELRDLLDDLNRSYRSRLNRKHGLFSQSEPKPILEKLLEAFVSDDLTFIAFTQALMRVFEEEINGKTVELDTHFLFAIERLEREHLFYFYGISQNELVSFNESLELASIHVLDTGVSLFGLRVDIEEWKNRPKSAYISAIPPRGKTDFTDAFFKITGFEDGLDKEEATLSFLEGIEFFARELPEDKVKDYKEKVVEYCVAQDKKDEPIDISQLSSNLEGIDCEKFVKAMLPHNPVNESGEEEKLMIDRSSLKRYARFFGREKDLSISFSSAELNNRISYNQDTDTLTIHGLPKSLRKQLLKYNEN